MSAPTLAYTVHPGRGPHLAMLHGFLSSSAQWQNNLDALAEVCQPVTIDLWGHGNSPAPNDPEHYQPQAYVQALEEIRKALNVEQWFLCGYSLGAGITIRYTHTFPKQVHAHLFTNSTSGFADTDQIKLWREDADASAARIREGGLAAIKRIPVHPRFAKRLPKNIYDALTVDAEHLSPVGIANAMQSTTPNVGIREIAPANPRPALLCFGTLEKRFAKHRDWAAQHMSKLDISELNAGHAVNMEDAPGFNKAACDFIRRHTP